MRLYSAQELDLLESAAFEGCVADVDAECEPFTADELSAMYSLRARGLVVPRLCENCAYLARTYGTSPDDDLTHWDLTDLGRIALRLARTLRAA